MSDETWTAVEVDDEFVTFSVTDGITERKERRYKNALPLMFVSGGYPIIVGLGMMDHQAGWRFRKIGENIYLDLSGEEAAHE